jgi:two-component system, NtrC family, nitrogen regulation sensor histidine kinase NtrY
MTLAQRLLLAIGAVTVAATLLVGFGVRDAWRKAEEQRFNEAFQAALVPLQTELAEESSKLELLVAPLCRDDEVVDSALVALLSNELAERRLALSLRVPKLAVALQLDELRLITSQGDILGAEGPAQVGKRNKALAARLAKDAVRGLRREEPVAQEYGCRKSQTEGGRVWVGLYAARHVGPLLERVGNRFGVDLHQQTVRPTPELMTATISVPQLAGMSLTASRSRTPLVRAIEAVDTAILASGSLALLAALVFAYVLARGLSRPIVELSRQARQVVDGTPKPVVARGGRELQEFAAAFNSTLADLVALRKRLAVSERIAARREIARRVAHEIKNPLAPIRAAVETLRRLRARNDPAFDEYFDEASRTVLDEVNRIAGIVTEFTRFARLPAPAPAPMDLKETVRSVVNLHAASGVPIAFEADVLPELLADRDQVVQVMTNLLSNAADAVRGRTEGRIAVAIKHEGDRAVVEVQDNGPGVDPAIRERLFEPYATTKPEGTGLGLAIVERIAVEHGGAISYRQAPGGGAIFSLELPLAGPSLPPEPPPSSRISEGPHA